MKKRMAALLACLLIAMTFASAMALELDYTALSDKELDELIREATAERSSRQTVHVPEAVHASPDKYTWYVQDYVGRNAAGFGYTSLGGDRLEKYGAGYLEFIFVTEDGTYADIKDDATLQKYIVTGQNIAPNTEMKYVFETDSQGKLIISSQISAGMEHLAEWLFHFGNNHFCLQFTFSFAVLARIVLYHIIAFSKR